SGAATLLFDRPGTLPTPKNAAGLAGTFSWNDMEMTTEALIIGATINASEAQVTATREGNIRGIAAAVSVATNVTGGRGAAAVGAGSVGYNSISDSTRASLDGATVTVAGPLVVAATDRSSILAVALAGGGAGANAAGGLAAEVSAAGA